MPIIRTSIGGGLRQARRSAGLTQDEVASDFLRSRQAISSWERGKTLPSLEEFRDLLVLYGVSADKVLFGVQNTTTEAADVLQRVSGSGAQLAAP